MLVRIVVRTVVMATQATDVSGPIERRVHVTRVLKIPVLNSSGIAILIFASGLKPQSLQPPRSGLLMLQLLLLCVALRAKRVQSMLLLLLCFVVFLCS